MRLLTATRQTQGDLADDFDIGTIEGELVEPAPVCDRDLDDEADNDCGCGRAFVGMTSRRSTTTAIITELDITYEQLRGIVAALDHQQGADPEDVDAMTAQLLDMARDYDTGSIAGILRYNLRARS